MSGRGIRAKLMAGASALAAGLLALAPAHAGAQSASLQSAADDYAWIDRADALSEAIGDAPPDLTFAFEGGQPFAWIADDGSTLIVERRGDGPYGYYFDPHSDTPYLVREPEVTFAFARDQLAVMYDADGRVLSADERAPYLDDAMQGLERGRALKRAMLAGERRDAMPVTDWIDLSLFLIDWNQQWELGRHRYPGWMRHHRRPDAIRWHGQFDRDGRRWLGQQQQFQRWQERGYQGPAPGRWTTPTPGEWDVWRRDRDHRGPGHPSGRPRGDGPPRPGRPGTPGTPPEGQHHDGPPRSGTTVVVPAIPPAPPPRPVASPPPPAPPPQSPMPPRKPGMPDMEPPVESDTGAPVPGTMAPNATRRPWNPGGGNRPRPVPQPVRVPVIGVPQAPVVVAPPPSPPPSVSRPMLDRPFVRPAPSTPQPAAPRSYTPPPASRPAPPPPPRPAPPPSPPRPSKQESGEPPVDN